MHQRRCLALCRGRQAGNVIASVFDDNALAVVVKMEQIAESESII